MNTPQHKVVAQRLGEYHADASDKSNKRRHLGTPQSATPTPVNTTAEKNASARKRKAKRVRSMLAFGGEQAQQGAQGAGGSNFSQAELSAMLDACLRMAADKKINERNVWSLQLLEHLPEMVSSQRGGSAGAFNFQRATVGLDAGMQIYEKRVDSTFNEAMRSMVLAPKTAQAAADERGEDGEGEDDDAAARGDQPDKGRRRTKDLDPASTLADPESIKGKPAELTFETDPLFVRTSALFDQGGAEGLLMNNLSTYNGYTLLFDSDIVPEEAFARQASAAPSNALVDLSTLASFSALAEQQQQLDRDTGIQQLEQLLGTAAEDRAAQLAADEELVREALRTRQRAAAPAAPCQVRVYRARPARTAAGAPIGAAAGEAADEEDTAMLQGCDARVAPSAAGQLCQGADDADAGPAESAGPAFEMVMDEGVADQEEEQQQFQQLEDTAAGYDAVAEFQATLQAELEEAAAAVAGDDDDAGEAGWGAEGDEDGEDYQQASENRTQQLLAKQASSTAASTDWLSLLASGATDTSSSTWQGKGTWRFKGAAAAARTAKLHGVRTARSKAMGRVIDFEDLPAWPEFRPGTRKTTCLQRRAKVKARLAPQASYDVSRLARPFGLIDVTISSFWLQQAQQAATMAAQQQGDGAAWGAQLEEPAGGDYDGDGGGDGFGYEGYDDDDIEARSGDEDPLDPDATALDLVQAPRRVAKTGVTYSRASKQVDVRALKDIVWQGLEHGHTAIGAGTAGNATASISFQDVLSQVPAQSKAGDLQDLSVHLCFICLLHLANENGLVIKGSQDLKTLEVANLPTARA